jgi:pimeloyl-ACP methyl ester carboxylesterase
VTWNGVGQALRFSKRQLAQWEEDGELEFTNARTGQRMSIDYAFVVDCLEHRARFDLAAQATRMEAAHLILHGDLDLAVDPKEGEMLRAGREAPACELRMIEKGSHTYGAVHPFEGSTPALDAALEASVAWFHTHLMGG